MEMLHGFGDNVVSLVRRRKPMKFSAISQVDAYWEGLRRGRAMPLRSEVDPRGLEGALEFAFMLDHIAPGVGRLRVAGIHLAEVLGMEVRGMPLTAFFEPVARDRISQTLADVVAGPKVADILLTSSRGIGRPPLSARMYLAPLKSEVDGRARILGCLQSDGVIGRAPRRFTIEKVQMRRIVGATNAPPTSVAEARLEQAFAEDPVPFRHAPAAGTRPGKPNLRLVKTDS